jgi:hypothetical protein
MKIFAGILKTVAVFLTLFLRFFQGRESCPNKTEELFFDVGYKQCKLRR